MFFSPLFYLLFIGRHAVVRKEKALVRSRILWNKLLEWVRVCWGGNDVRVDENSEENSGNNFLNLQIVPWLLFGAASAAPTVEGWQVGHRADPALVPLPVLLTPKDRRWCFCWGRILAGTSSRSHAGALTATCKHPCWQQCPETTNKKAECKLHREPGRMTGAWPLLLLTPFWIYNGLNLLDGQTDNRVSNMNRFIREVCELLNLLMLVEN